MTITPPKHIKKHHAAKGFTLIEILVVMAIIALLAGIALGPLMDFLDRGKETESKKMATDLVFAISQFKDDYDYLPYVGTLDSSTDTKVVTEGEEGAKFLAILMGKEPDNGDALNDKGTEYFTVKRAKGGRNGLVYDSSDTKVTKLVDHWTNPFTIVLDTDQDGIILETEFYSDSTKKHNKDTALVATPGKDREFNHEHDIKSW